MDDTLKTLIYGFLGTIVIHGALERRAAHDAARQVRDAFASSSAVRARVEPRGMFGALGNRFYAVDIFGTGLATNQLPFVAVPRPGWKGSIRHLRLHFDNMVLRGVAIDRLDADLPNVTYDIGQALYRDRLVIRGAGDGSISVRIGADGLRDFILRKYRRTLSDIQVSFRDERVMIVGKLAIFGIQSPFIATGRLEQRDGRYVDLSMPSIEMNGRTLTSEVTANVLREINPVLDISTDLGLAGYITLSRIVIGVQEITISGRAAIPRGTRQNDH